MKKVFHHPAFIFVLFICGAVTIEHYAYKAKIERAQQAAEFAAHCAKQAIEAPGPFNWDLACIGRQQTSDIPLPANG